ncbi:cell wall hydrolase [Phenylobacterium sp.]|uniref:cell wall hydrolase n=1 Tax=Phenylobacterium sp. TaxID=1871053 RepID=UPI0035B4263A
MSHEQRRWAAAGMSPEALKLLASSMDPSARAIAVRHDPFLRQADTWNRPEGWESLDIDQAPDLGLPQTGQTAQEINELRPFADLPIRPMKPFVLTAAGKDRERALECLTQAVYYEAAREPGLGQEAVAQVVLNRVRHPAYPKSICAVVYQGAARATGCQFTFTCDGSLRWAPEPALWSRARRVAERALNGHVAKHVGSATHYHASYVAPYWAPTLVKMTQVGAHIFYRWTGPWGEPPAFTGRYAGHEADLTPAVLNGFDARTQGLLSPETQGVPPSRTVKLDVAGEVRTYTVADATAAGGERTRVKGTLYAARRQPTADEVRQINERLAAVERDLEAPRAADVAQAARPASEPAARATD